MDRTLRPAVLLLLALVVFFETTRADLALQDHFYQFDRRAWLVDADACLPRLLFYTGPKVALWAFGVCMLGLSFAPARMRRRLPFSRVGRRNLWVLVATMAAGPLLIATGKAATNVFTPREIRRYGGFAPYVKVIGSYPENDRPEKRGHGFPAGHASGGFSLMALAGIARGRRGRLAGIAAGLAAGGVMGFYQMLRGAHFLSHTLISAVLCWIVFLLLRRAFGVADRGAPAAR